MALARFLALHLGAQISLDLKCLCVVVVLAPFLARVLVTLAFGYAIGRCWAWAKAHPVRRTYLEWPDVFCASLAVLGSLVFAVMIFWAILPVFLGLLFAVVAVLRARALQGAQAETPPADAPA